VRILVSAQAVDGALVTNFAVETRRKSGFVANKCPGFACWVQAGKVYKCRRALENREEESGMLVLHKKCVESVD